MGSIYTTDARPVNHPTCQKNPRNTPKNRFGTAFAVPNPHYPAKNYQKSFLSSKRPSVVPSATVYIGAVRRVTESTIRPFSPHDLM